MKVIRSQIKIIIYSFLLSFIITHGVVLLALGVGVSEKTDSFILKIIRIVRPNEAEFYANPDNRPVSRLRSENPGEWLNLDIKHSSAVKKDFRNNLIYLYILICVFYYPLLFFKKQDQAFSETIYPGP